MHEHLAGVTDTEGVLFVGRAQEKTKLFRTEKRYDEHGNSISVDRAVEALHLPAGEVGLFGAARGDAQPDLARIGIECEPAERGTRAARYPASTSSCQ